MPLACEGRASKMIRQEPQLTEAFSIALHVEQVDTCFPEPRTFSKFWYLFLYLVYRKKLTLEGDGSHGPWVTDVQFYGRQILSSLKLYSLFIIFICMCECCMNLCVSCEYRRLQRPEKGFRYSGNWLLATI